MPVSNQPIGPFSNPARIGKLDKRTGVARFLKFKRLEIREYLRTLGITELNYEQEQILERICFLHLHIHLADMKALQTPMSDIAARTYAGFVGAIPRLMVRLRAPAQAAADTDDDSDLQQYIANVQAGRQEVAG
jgi:hypothetical protein